MNLLIVYHFRSYILAIHFIFKTLTDHWELGQFTMVSQPIDLGRLVVSSGSIVLILFDTLIDVRLKLHHPKGVRVVVVK